MFQKQHIGKDDWIEISETEVRQHLVERFSNVDDLLDELRDGYPVCTALVCYRYITDEPTTQPTLDWQYLPELPTTHEELLVAVKWPGTIHSDAILSVFPGLFYDGKWMTGKQGNLVGVYAWAEWPEAPSVREKP